MSIVSSEIEVEWDGWVREKHVDSAGKAHTHTYYAAGVDKQVALASYAVDLAAILADIEADGVING